MKKFLSPIYACFDITSKCNLKCGYCVFRDDRKDLTTHEIKQKLDWLEENKFLSVQFAGGEPLMRKDFDEILEYASQKKYTLSLATNGILLTDNKIENIKRANVRLVQISLDGTKCQNDDIRGRGVFEIVLKNIKKLQANNIAVGVATIVTNENRLYINNMIHQLSILKLEYIRLQKIIKSDMNNDIDLKTFLDVFISAKKYVAEKNINIPITLPCYLSDNYVEEKCENVFLDILSDGTLRNCFVNSNCKQEFISVSEYIKTYDSDILNYYICSRAV